MFQHLKFLEIKIHPKIIILFFLVVMFMMAGCSTVTSIEKSTKKMVRDFKAPDGDLKKKVAIALFENKTPFKDEGMDEKIIENLAGTITSSCSNILLEKPGDSDYPDELVNLPRKVSGRIDNFDLAKIGRRLGLNAIITGAVINISPDNKQEGILWFKDTHYYIRPLPTKWEKKFATPLSYNPGKDSSLPSMPIGL
ncbi:MAG: hypothetical protein P8012_11870 [Desulfobacterales bacterium]